VSGLASGQPGSVVVSGVLDSVSAASAASAWAVGSNSLGGDGPAVIEHWDGKTWTWPPGFCGGSSGPGCLTPPSSPSSQ